jgi:hypothetical protein
LISDGPDFQVKVNARNLLDLQFHAFADLADLTKGTLERGAAPGIASSRALPELRRTLGDDTS